MLLNIWLDGLIERQLRGVEVGKIHQGSSRILRNCSFPEPNLIDIPSVQSIEAHVACSAAALFVTSSALGPPANI